MNILQRMIDFLGNLLDSIPTIQCTICLRWFGKNVIEFHQTTTGLKAPVCPNCWEHLNRY